jgi:hypothetical protein
MRLLSLLAAATLASAASAEEPGYLFDALRTPRFRMSWERLIRDVQPTPDWLLHFERNFDGVAGEMKQVEIAGKPYRLSFVCKPEDCAGHKFEVLFGAEGGQAYGALGGKDEPPAFFGAPDAAMQAELAKALQPAATETGAAQPKSE